MPQGGGVGIAPGGEELALADDGDGDGGGGLKSFVALVGGPVLEAAQANGRNRGARGGGEGEEDELHGRSRVLLRREINVGDDVCYDRIQEL
jgi:hypothetical protein